MLFALAKLFVGFSCDPALGFYHGQPLQIELIDKYRLFQSMLDFLNGLAIVVKHLRHDHDVAYFSGFSL